MVIRLKWSYIISSLLVLVISISGVTIAFQHMEADDAVKEAVLVFEELPVSEKLLVYLFLDSIREQSDLFYEPYYTDHPSVAYYFTTVKEIKETEADIYITFSISPYIGPHDTIGEDEVTFRVNHAGKFIVEEFRHLKNYALPDNLSHIVKGELPPISE